MSRIAHLVKGKALRRTSAGSAAAQPHMFMVWAYPDVSYAQKQMPVALMPTLESATRLAQTIWAKNEKASGEDFHMEIEEWCLQRHSVVLSLFRSEIHHKALEADYA